MAQLSLPQPATEDTSLLHLQYGLMSAFVLIFPLLLALFINLSLRKSDCCRLCIAHLNWQRNSMLGLLAGAAFWYWLPTNWLTTVLLATVIAWFVLRIVKGWISLIDRVPVAGSAADTMPSATM